MRVSEGLGKKVFAREATGLIRRLGFVDQFIVAMAIVNVTGGYVFTMIAAPYFFPGANMVAVFALGAIPAFAFVITYSIFSAAMPRSGGDYVWTGRILGPRFAAVLAIIILLAGSIYGPAFNFWLIDAFALAQLFLAWGIVTGNASLVSIGATISSPPYGYVISLLAIAIVLIIGLFGTEVFRKINRYSFIVYVVTTIVFVAGILSISRATYNTAFDAAMSSYNVTHSQIDTAISSNPQLASFNLSSTILAIVPLGFLTYSGFNFNTYLSGETKDVSSTMPKSLLAATVVTLIALVIITSIVNATFGAPFVGGISYLYNTGALASVPVQPTINFLVALGLPTWFGVLININVMLGFFLVALSYTMTFSRILFAMAFDRLIPGKFADVNDKYGSPHYSILLITIISVIFTTLWWYAGLVFGYLNGTFALDAGYLIPGFAALVFPFVRKDLYERTVGSLGGWFKLKIGGVPLLSFGGAAILLIWGFGLYSLLNPTIPYTYLGSALPFALGTTLGLIIFGIIIFEASRRYHLAKDAIDITLAYKEIPPE
jgi:amino acid transporter